MTSFSLSLISLMISYIEQVGPIRGIFYFFSCFHFLYFELFNLLFFDRLPFSFYSFSSLNLFRDTSSVSKTCFLLKIVEQRQIVKKITLQ